MPHNPVGWNWSRKPQPAVDARLRARKRSINAPPRPAIKDIVDRPRHFFIRPGICVCSLDGERPRNAQLNHDGLTVIRQATQAALADQRLRNHLIKLRPVHKVAIETAEKARPRDRCVYKPLPSTMTFGDSVYAEFIDGRGKAARNVRPARMACKNRAQARSAAACVQWAEAFRLDSLQLVRAQTAAVIRDDRL
jgi:hypothetical protein